MNELGKSLRNSFLAGLLVVGPVAASIFVTLKLFEKFTNLLLLDEWKTSPYSFLYRIVAVVVFLALMVLVGWITRLMIGKRLLTATENIITRVPLLNKIYLFIKEVSDTMLGRRKTVFDRVVLFEYPRPGVYAVGFVTNEDQGEIQHKTSSQTINVFLPTTPNPTSGFLLIVPRDQIINLDMSVTDGMKLVISGGAVAPPYKPRLPNNPPASSTPISPSAP